MPGQSTRIKHACNCVLVAGSDLRESFDKVLMARRGSLIAMAALCLLGCMPASRSYPPVPAPPAEMVPAPPRSSVPLIWQPGHYDWDGARYIWVPGHWVDRAGHGTLWQDGYWQRAGAGFTWVPPHWM